MIDIADIRELLERSKAIGGEYTRTLEDTLPAVLDELDELRERFETFHKDDLVRHTDRTIECLRCGGDWQEGEAEQHLSIAGAPCPSTPLVT